MTATVESRPTPGRRFLHVAPPIARAAGAFVRSLAAASPITTETPLHGPTRLCSHRRSDLHRSTGSSTNRRPRCQESTTKPTLRPCWRRSSRRPDPMRNGVRPNKCRRRLNTGPPAPVEKWSTWRGVGVVRPGRVIWLDPCGRDQGKGVAWRGAVGGDPAVEARGGALAARDPSPHRGASRHDPQRAGRRRRRRAMGRGRRGRRSSSRSSAVIEELLAEEPTLSGVRVREELERLGYAGGKTILDDLLARAAAAVSAAAAQLPAHPLSAWRAGAVRSVRAARARSRSAGARRAAATS